MRNKCGPSRVLSTIFISTLILQCQLAKADDFASFESQFKHDNNVGNSRVRYAVGDTVFTNTLNLGQRLSIGEDPYFLSFAGKLSGSSYNQLTGLGHRDVGFQFDLQKKWGLGPYAPIFGAQLAYERQLFQQTDRTQNIQRFELRASKRVLDSLNLSARWSSTQHHPSDNTSVEEDHPGNVYETRYRNWNFSADYTVFGDHTISLQYGHRNGDLVVTTIADSAAIYNVAKAIRPDPSFGPDRDAYRLEGTIKTWGLSYTLPITRQWNLQLDAQQHDSRVSNSVSYSRKVIGLAAHYQF